MTRPHRVAIAALCTVVLLLLPSWAMRHDRAQAVAEREAALAALEARNDELRQQNALVLDEVTTLGDDGARLEHHVRDRLGWLLPDETVVEVVVPDEGAR